MTRDLLAESGLAVKVRAMLRQFNQRSTRERMLLVAAGAAVALMLADTLWLGPALNAFRAARTARSSAVLAQSNLQADIDRLQNQGRTQLQQKQSELLSWRQRVREGDAALRQHEDSLVGPERMVGLLEQLLAHHGEVRLRALRSLGRSDLLVLGQATAAGGASVAADTSSGSGLYRHGVELVLEGSYADLLGYLRAVEALPQRVLWGGISLKVEQYPRATLTLRVFTLSRERHWLEI